jgi:glutamyl-tRNA reductase
MNTYPVNLLLQAKRCLIVGGGRVATRKLERLLISEAAVTVIARRVSTRIREAAETGKIIFIERDFREADLDGFFLAFAATDDRALNRKIIDATAKRAIICCSTDENWRDSSFITPATVSCGDIVIAVSSQGTSCRKTRLIKENLARHITSIENAELTVIGTNHNCLSLAQREPLHLVGERLERAGEMIRQIWGIHGFALLNTCNRVELITAAHLDDATLKMLKMILGFDKLNENDFYIKTDHAAFQHLCLTVAGLYSQTPGEKHIAGQFKRACELAEKRGWAGSLVHSLHDHVLQISRMIRNAVAPHLHGIDIEDLALEFIKSRHPELTKLRCAVLGSGETGTQLTQLLTKEKLEVCWFYRNKKPSLGQDNVTVHALEKLKDILPDIDIIFTALGGEEAFITSEFAPHLKAGVEIIDLGTPRNVAAVSTAGSITNMDDLKHWHRRENCDMPKVMKIADKTIREQQEIYERFRKSYIDGRKG